MPAARTHTHPRTHSQNSAFWDFFQMGHPAKFLINALSNFCIIPRWYENIPDAATTTVCGIRELERAREMWINKFFLQSAHRPLSPRVCAAAHLGACINAGALSWSERCIPLLMQPHALLMVVCCVRPCPGYSGIASVIYVFCSSTNPGCAVSSSHPHSLSHQAFG